MNTEWLGWIRRLQAIAQSGLTYARDPYDVERYRQVRRIASEIAASGSGKAADTIEALFSEGTGYATPKIDIRPQAGSLENVSRSHGTSMNPGKSNERARKLGMRSEISNSRPRGATGLGSTHTGRALRSLRKNT